MHNFEIFWGQLKSTPHSGMFSGNFDAGHKRDKDPGHALGS